MRDRYQDFQSREAALAAIGLGTPDEARAFSIQNNVPFPVLADPERRSYRALSLQKAVWNEVIGPRIWRAGVGALMRGRGITLPKQDPLQLGGSAVILAGGEVAYLHRARDSADNAPVDELLGTL